MATQAARDETVSRICSSTPLVKCEISGNASKKQGREITSGACINIGPKENLADFAAVGWKLISFYNQLYKVSSFKEAKRYKREISTFAKASVDKWRNGPDRSG